METPIQTADEQLQVLLGMMPPSWKVQFAWSYLDRDFQDLLTFPNCGDQAIYIKAQSLFKNLDEPEKQEEIMRAQVSNISGDFMNACIAIIANPEPKVPTKALFTIAKRQSNQFTTRDISGDLKDEDVSVTNITTTMESLVRKKFIRAIETEEGKEQIYELTQTGRIEIKRLLKM